LWPFAKTLNSSMEHEASTVSENEEIEDSSVCSFESGSDEDENVELDEAVVNHIDTVLGATCCEKRCLENRAEGTTAFLRGYMKMTKDCQRTSLITALAMCSGFAEEGQRHRSTGARIRYTYVVPLVGQVCRRAFLTVFNVSNDTITR
ncbi:hypothetical protein BBJ28_00026410, partial [Nothophytophthora sp. Chile5]